MNTKTIAVFLTVLTAATLFLSQYGSQNINQDVFQFENWKQKHKISFKSQAQNLYRQGLYFANKAKVLLHNSHKERTYDMGINQFSALSDDQFEQTYLGLKLSQPQLQVHLEKHDHTIKVGDVDWTTQGAVTGIKDQGQCGSCWAFSTTGSLQALSKLQKGKLRSFSQQQLIDCSGSYGNQGCNGGLMDNAFKFVMDNGILLESEYPYKAVKQVCKNSTGPFKISRFIDLKTCNDLANAISGRPISVGIDATNWSRYASGVFNNCATRINHGVLLVGIVDQNWKIKNSWGSSWGENGYIRLQSGNTCGICNLASYPQLII